MHEYECTLIIKVTVLPFFSCLSCCPSILNPNSYGLFSSVYLSAQSVCIRKDITRNALERKRIILIWNNESLLHKILYTFFFFIIIYYNIVLTILFISLFLSVIHKNSNCVIDLKKKMSI